MRWFQQILDRPTLLGRSRLGSRRPIWQGEQLESRCLLHGAVEHSATTSNSTDDDAALRFAAFDALTSPALLEARISTAPSAGEALAWPAVAAAPQPAAAPGDELLPDMFSWADTSRGYMYGSYVDTATQPGHRLLRFSTAVPNTGAGMMELRGGAVLPNGTQEVYQRIAKEGGGFNEYLAGTFIYHAEHTHIHFNGYAVYNLRQKTAGDGVGDIVATGGKVSFCLLDVARYTPGSPGAHYTSCGQSQGISVGWADVYAANLPDQWIDVTTVPAGNYWLEVSIDPDNLLRESNETNNITRVSVTIGGPTASGDRFEPNNTTATATDLGTISHRSEDLLSIHSTTDHDYFRFVAAGSGTLNLSAAFNHSVGDIDMTLLGSNLLPIASSDSNSDLEQVTAQVQQGATYYIHVFGYSGATNSSYRLTIDAPTALGTISGVVWDDINADGARDAEEAGLPGRVVYIDENHNGRFDSAPPVVEQFTPTDVPLPILDINTVESSIVVSGLSRPIASVSVSLSITHTYDEDLDVVLISPLGTRVELFSDVGADGDHFLATTIRDTAAAAITNGTAPFSNTYRPEEPLSTLAGEMANGAWRLELTDDAAADIGTLVDWSITITTQGHFEPSAFSAADGSYSITVAPAGTVTVREVLPPLWRFTYPTPDAVHVVDVASGGTTNSVNFGNVATTAPRISQVALQQSGASSPAYVLPSGLGQLAPVMLPALDQIVVTFDRAWGVTAESLLLAGVSIPEYSFAAEQGFIISNPGSATSEMTAVWTLAAPLNADRLLLSVAGASVLDGEWTNPDEGLGSEFPSGDGTAGGDFAFRFNVLPGDANQDSIVSNADIAELLHYAFVSEHGDEFQPAMDLNGDRVVNALDAIIIRDRLATALPQGTPGGSPSAPASILAQATGSDADQNEILPRRPASSQLIARRRATTVPAADPAGTQTATDSALSAGDRDWSLHARRQRTARA